MNIEKVLADLDQLFEDKKIDQVEGYLTKQLETALLEQDTGAVLTLLNEMIGFYREMCEYEKSVLYGEKALPIIAQAGLLNSVYHGTTLLNLATGNRAAGNLSKAITLYEETEAIYRLHFSQDAKEYASLYNNKSLAYQEMGEYEKAAVCLEKALDIVQKHPEMGFELAVTYANLGNSYLKIPGKETEAKEALENAVSLFMKRGSNGNHYGAALMGLGEVFQREGKLSEALGFYKRSMDTILETIGHTDYYYMVKERYEQVLEILRMQGEAPEAVNGLTLSKRYYEEIVAPMLAEKFPELEGQLAIGLVGEGSDCYGFDDEASRDHDWGPTVCIFLTRKQEEAYGAALRTAYEELPKYYCGYQRKETVQGQNRTGILTIDGFYKRLLETEKIDLRELAKDGAMLTEEDCQNIPEYGLAAATNGAVFAPGEGTFVTIRENLKAFYPESFRLLKLAQACAVFSQHLQYNYPRMLFRKDALTASMLLHQGIEQAYIIGYLLAKRYRPHGKWLVKGLSDTLIGEKLEGYAKELLALHQALPENVTDAMLKKSLQVIDKTALLLLEEMAAQKLIGRKKDMYMESYAPDLVLRAFYERKEKEALVENVVLLEWEAFDKVKNEGGRADCQDNWNTFHIMRASQYRTWTKEMLVQYACDFKASVDAGWNPIMEKYGRMEESTAPFEYAKIKDELPVLSEQKKQIMEEIIKIQVGWMEAFAKEYPNMAGNARSIHTSEDTPYNTSYETYLRGELGTYTDAMLSLYGNFIVELARKEDNLAYLIMEQTAFLYGYESLQDAENSLSE